MALTEQGLAFQGRHKARHLDILLLTFVGSIFTSAFLLFAVQPMFSKMVLPLLGGSPGVWSVAMVVFQSLLLAGYGYAHLSTRFLTLKAAACVHIALYGLAALSLPLAVSGALGDAPPQSGQELWLAAVFLLSVGLPFFAVSANGPLLQHWFSRSSHPTAHDPYYLYGASNLGSFASLLLYPVAIEPLLTLGAQTTMWSVGFGVLGLMLSACAWLVAANPGAQSITTTSADAAPAPGARLLLTWTALAFVPSGLLVAVTAHLSTDVAAAPFLWVLPLAIYLASYVAMFRARQAIPLPALAVLTAVFATFAAHALTFAPETLVLDVAIHLALLGCVAFLCHGRMYAMRPPAQHLTTFYLVMSFGGVLGGIFSGLIAPAVFNRIVEYPLLIVASLLCIPAIHGAGWRRQARMVAPWVLAAIGFAVLFNALRGTLPPGVLPLTFLALLAVGLLAYARPLMTLGAVSAMLIIGPHTIANGAYHRSFFGVHRIFASEDGVFRKLTHGSTVHGSIMIRSPDGKPLPARPEATTYYHPDLPMAEAIRSLSARGPAQDFGVVGLGAGALVCNGRDEDRWSYYEIDPIVIRIAQDPAMFRFLSACAPDTTIVAGDARLTLARETKRFDALVIDAFSSDAIPVHLMTREALRMYAERLKPGGLLVMHISNRHLELDSVVAALAQDAGLAAVTKFKVVKQLDAAYPSKVVALARREADLADLKALGWRETKPLGTAVWTDNYSNILGAIWRQYRAN